MKAKSTAGTIPATPTANPKRTIRYDDREGCYDCDSPYHNRCAPPRR